VKVIIINKKHKKFFYFVLILLIFESFFIIDIPANLLKKELEFYNLDNVDNNNLISSSIGFNAKYHYIIITKEDFLTSNFQLLIAHKSQYMNATIVTIEDILADSSFWVNGTYGDATNNLYGNPFIDDGEEVTNNFDLFNDTEAKIRNFIRYANLEWGTKYVLLGGDVQTIPVRKLYVNISGWDAGFIFDRSIEGWIPSDLYYGALDGTWNDNFNEKFGERGNSIEEDEADLFAEVFVGRAPVDGKYDIATFVKKVIEYETNEKPNSVLLHQSNLLPIRIPDTSKISEKCAEYIPSSYNIKRLYQKNELIDNKKWASSFKDPDKLLVLHIGNGYFLGPTNSWYQLYYNILGRGKFLNTDIGKLRNEFYPLHISISCMSGNFVFSDCIGEELLLWSEGGPSACFFNSEVGCVKKENIIKYSGEFIKYLFFELFQNGTQNLGKINQYAKEHFSGDVHIDPNYRWVYFETNLLGDPETPAFEIRNKLPPSYVYVDDDFNENTSGWGVTHFNKITDGIKASFINGFVYVYSGTYNENIVIDKTVQVIGEDKNSTTIIGADEKFIVLIKSNASCIKNFTIKPNEDNKNTIGVYIPIDSWGNIVENNIIINNSLSGIAINGSCRTIINGNIIKSNGNGICLTKQIEGLFEKYIVITCNNIIEHNEITLNSGYGIYMQGVLNNQIIKNNFIDNSGESAKDAYFYLSRGNEWNENYWNKPLTEPKLIKGIWGPIYPPIIDFSDGLIFPKLKYPFIINIGFPRSDKDNNPAQSPYNIK